MTAQSEFQKKQQKTRVPTVFLVTITRCTRKQVSLICPQGDHRTMHFGEDSHSNINTDTPVILSEYDFKVHGLYLPREQSADLPMAKKTSNLLYKLKTHDVQ